MYMTQNSSINKSIYQISFQPLATWFPFLEA